MTRQSVVTAEARTQNDGGPYLLCAAVHHCSHDAVLAKVKFNLTFGAHMGLKNAPIFITILLFLPGLISKI